MITWRLQRSRESWEAFSKAETRYGASKEAGVLTVIQTGFLFSKYHNRRAAAALISGRGIESLNVRVTG